MHKSKLHVSTVHGQCDTGTLVWLDSQQTTYVDIYQTNTLAWYIRNKLAWIHDNLIHYIKYTLALIHGAHNLLARLLDPYKYIYNAPAWMNDQCNMLAWLLYQYIICLHVLIWLV